MSRWSLEEDERDWDALPPSATCQGCGIDFVRAHADQGLYCDACSDRLDALTANLELRMATADLPTRAHKGKVA